MKTPTVPIAFSGNIPRYYDAFLGPLFFEPFALAMADRISQVQPTSVLELASGTGRLTRLLKAATPAGAQIIASDINPAMVNFGKEQVNVNWQEIDAVSLPFPDEQFDLIAVQFGVMFYSDREQAFREALRVLKPGGKMIFSCWDELRHNPIAQLTDTTLSKFFPVNTPAFYQVPFSYHDENLIRQEVLSAGFRELQIELLPLQGFGSSPENVVKGLIQGTPTVTAIEERDASLLPAFMKQLEHRIEELFGKSKFQVPLQARIVHCFK